MFVWRVFPGRADARPGAFLASPALEEAGIRAAFTGRAGGVSPDPYASLNLSFFSGDDPDRVRANRARVLAALGAPAGSWTNGRQVHGARVAHVDAANAGAGAADAHTSIPETDGLWTEEPGAALAILVADCVPVLLADVAARRIAALHAGWRGLVAGILERGVEALEKEGSDPARLAAFIGPAIGPCHYEVGEDVAAPARESLGDAVVSRRDDATFLDLWAGARIALERAGVREVWRAALCTRCEPHRFYSHRAGSEARQGLVAVIA